MNTSNARRRNVHQFKETARQDPYRSQNKPRGTPRCPVCESVSIQGRWVSSRKVKSLSPPVLVTGKLKCPACKQLEDRFAMGVIELAGEKWRKNKETVMNTIQNTQDVARNRNDQERVLWIKDMDNVTKIYVSLPELARQIGRELEKSFQGKTKYQRSTEEPYLRVRWQSDSADQRELPHKSKAFRARSGKA